MKVLGKEIIERRTEKIIQIGNMQFGFMTSRGKTCYFHSSSAVRELRGRDEYTFDGFCSFEGSIW